MSDTKAAAIAGGIQAHSVGAAYPLALVGVGDDWLIQDLTTGLYAARGNTPRAWGSAADAVKYLAYLGAVGRDSTRWCVHPGRPHDVTVLGREVLRQADHDR